MNFSRDLCLWDCWSLVGFVTRLSNYCDRLNDRPRCGFVVSTVHVSVKSSKMEICCSRACFSISKDLKVKKKHHFWTIHNGCAVCWQGLNILKFVSHPTYQCNCIQCIQVHRLQTQLWIFHSTGKKMKWTVNTPDLGLWKRVEVYLQSAMYLA